MLASAPIIVVVGLALFSDFEFQQSVSPLTPYGTAPNSPFKACFAPPITSAGIALVVYLTYNPVYDIASMSSWQLPLIGALVVCLAVLSALVPVLQLRLCKHSALKPDADLLPALDVDVLLREAVLPSVLRFVRVSLLECFFLSDVVFRVALLFAVP